MSNNSNNSNSSDSNDSSEEDGDVGMNVLTKNSTKLTPNNKARSATAQENIEKCKNDCGIPEMTSDKTICNKCATYVDNVGFPTGLDKRQKDSNWLIGGVDLNKKNCLDKLRKHIGGKLHSAGKWEKIYLLSF